uniref:Uncharacterized protein n=1 Tax=Chromera velia CCMP2878 TaxID=1169474 RepID=A0A0G4HU69_9ALVE|eukprot:Cvel_8604.t1-p1 / transcript=Cvel_8604.t1 / gene=Cvel_8604 / organism=Chromera_velia_CCMP2878 / gene_product=hypothetical protein / transcript_product=hypothetical protein / location=Cvel_scaffold478:4691-5244(-) / protein_length=78 / sequence_SO=supercontig / SO=protein_coding / is_pseudo=false
MGGDSPGGSDSRVVGLLWCGNAKYGCTGSSNKRTGSRRSTASSWDSPTSYRTAQPCALPFFENAKPRGEELVVQGVEE